MNSKGNALADAIIREVAEWPGVSVEISESGKHPKARMVFEGKRIFVPFSGTSSDASFALVKVLADVRRALRDLGAVRPKPEPTAADDREGYRKSNEGREMRPDPVVAKKTEPKPTIAEQFGMIRLVESPKVINAGLDMSTLAGREAAARADGWLADGAYDIEGERYHLDPCEEKSLSASLSKVMIEYSPWHAWTAHPRYNPEFEVQDKLAFRVGRAFHKLMLDKGGEIQVLDFADWRKSEAKAARDEAIAAGYTPLLSHQFEELEKQVRAAKRQIHAREELAYALAGGVAERAFIWTEQTPFGPVRCRMMADWTPHAGRFGVDLKTTGVSAGPNGWGQKVMWDTGCDIQDAFYRRGWRAHGIDIDAMIFAVTETKPPFAMMHHRCDPEAQAYADREVQWAINAWAICQSRDRWPGYPKEMAWQMRPGWRSAKIDARYETDERDLDALDRHLANLKEVGSVARRNEGAAVTDANPFGLDRIDQ